MIGRVIILAIAVLAACPGVSEAQVEPDLAARAIEEVAGLDLGMRASPTPDDYKLAADLLSLALELDPDNADMARSMSEAAWSSGDNESLIEATRAIVRADPRDAVAQLRLISTTIARAQTVPERLELYERFTGERASEVLPASVRSRLLLDAALLHRESGDGSDFELYLRRAARLDPTHKEAQALLAQTIASRGVSPSTLLRLQLRLLESDPIDPHIHITIARLCAEQSATDSAWRFLNNAADIYAVDRGQPPALLQEKLLALGWQYDGPQSILDRLNPALEDDRATLRARIESRLELDEPIDDLGSPEDIRYNAGIDRIRLLAAHALGDEETVDSVLTDLRLGVREVFDTVVEEMSRRGADRGYLLGIYLQEVITFQTMRSITGVDAETIQTDIDRIIEEAPSLEQFFRPFEPFSLYVNGEYERARELAVTKLTPSGARDLLIALSSDKLGETERAVAEYIGLTRDYALEAVGAFARSRLEQILDGEDIITDEGREMARLAGAVPEWIDRMINNPENTMRLVIRPVRATFAAHAPARVVIELQNLTSEPIALGPEHPIDTDMLIVPGFRGKSGDLNGTPRPKVVDLARRLRLKPLETLTVELDPDSIHTRWLLRTHCARNHTQRWRVMQGFKPSGRTGGLINSPFGLVTETELIERRPTQGAGDPPARIAERIAAGAGSTLVRAVNAATALLLDRPRAGALGEDALASISDALWDRYEDADAPTRAWMLAVLPSSTAAPEMDAFDRRVVEMHTGDALSSGAPDPGVLAMLVMTRVISPRSPALEIARTHDDGRVRYVAMMVERRIDEFEDLYAGVREPFETLTPAPQRDYGLDGD